MATLLTVSGVLAFTIQEHTSDNGWEYGVTSYPRVYFGLVEEIPVPLATRMGYPIFYRLQGTFMSQKRCKGKRCKL